MRPSWSSGKGWEALQLGREVLGGPPGGPQGVEKPIRRFGRGREAHMEVRECSGGPHRGVEEVGRPTQKTGSRTRRSRRGREAHPEVQDWVRRPTQMSGMGSGGLPGRSGGAWRSTRRFGRGREALPVGWVVSEGPPDGSGGVSRPIRMAGRGQE